MIGMIATDKLMHFGVCFVVNLIISAAMPSQATTGVGFSVGLSLGKEFGDSRAIGNKWDNYDLLADGVGIAAGVATGLYINNLIVEGLE